MTLAKENQNNFEKYLGTNPNANPGIDLTVTVLTTGFWPSYKSSDLCLPAEMVGFTYCTFMNEDVLNFFFASANFGFLLDDRGI